MRKYMTDTISKINKQYRKQLQPILKNIQSAVNDTYIHVEEDEEIKLIEDMKKINADN